MKQNGFVFAIITFAAVVFSCSGCHADKGEVKTTSNADTRFQIPIGTTFSNAVAILGTGYSISETNSKGFYFVISTNSGTTLIAFKDDAVMWSGRFDKN